MPHLNVSIIRSVYSKSFIYVYGFHSFIWLFYAYLWGIFLRLLIIMWSCISHADIFIGLVRPCQGHWDSTSSLIYHIEFRFISIADPILVVSSLAVVCPCLSSFVFRSFGMCRYKFTYFATVGYLRFCPLPRWGQFEMWWVRREGNVSGF